MLQCRLEKKMSFCYKKTYVAARAHASDQSGPRCPDSLYIRFIKISMMLYILVVHVIH